MIGPEGAAELGAAWLALELPGRLEQLATRLELADGQLPAPALVLPYDEPNLALEDWPAVFVVVEELLNLTLAEVHQDGGETYRSRYRALVFAWVRSDGYLEVDELRKRYVLAIREAMLYRKSLTPVPTYGAGTFGVQPPGIAVDVNSIRESLSPPLTDGNGRTIAGAYVECVLIVEEYLAGPPALGTALELDASPALLERDDTATVPPHPAL